MKKYKTQEELDARLKEIEDAIMRMPQRVIEQEREYKERKAFALHIFGDMVRQIEERKSNRL